MTTPLPTLRRLRTILRITALAVLLISILPAIDATAQSYPAVTPDEMPNVQKQDRLQFVSDPAGLLSPGATSQINGMIARMQGQTTAEMAVAVVPNLGDLEVETYAERLFTKWGIGKADKDNGVLLLISPGSRATRIQTGYGAEGVLPDGVCAKIIRRDIVPYMRDGDLDSAAVHATSAICNVLTDPAYAEELMSKQKLSPEAQIDHEALRNTFFGVVAIIIITALVWAVCMAAATRRKLKNSSNFQKAKEWRSRLKYLGLLAVLSALTALPVFLYALAAYRRNRNRTHVCDRCGAKMKKLDEQTDNLYLDPSQDLEERLGSVDYDVWLCPECGEVEKYPFKEEKSDYKECPVCGTRAYHMVYDRVDRHPTTRRPGLGTRVWHCEYCGHNHDDHYQIPRRESNGAVPFIVGAAAGGLMRGGGGGGFGGGFGGGATGGGGASGGW